MNIAGCLYQFQGHCNRLSICLWFVILLNHILMQIQNGNFIWFFIHLLLMLTIKIIAIVFPISRCIMVKWTSSLALNFLSFSILWFWTKQVCVVNYGTLHLRLLLGPLNRNQIGYMTLWTSRSHAHFYSSLSPPSLPCKYEIQIGCDIYECKAHFPFCSIWRISSDKCYIFNSRYYCILV